MISLIARKPNNTTGDHDDVGTDSVSELGPHAIGVQQPQQSYGQERHEERSERCVDQNKSERLADDDGSNDVAAAHTGAGRDQSGPIFSRSRVDSGTPAPSARCRGP
jgi:hypothetical protein